MIKSLFVDFEGEKFDQPSVTEPNQCLSISQILARYGSGALVNASQGVYDDDESDDIVDDPTLSPEFDFLDAYLLEQDLRLRAADADAQQHIEDNKNSENELKDDNSEPTKTASEPENEIKD